MVKETLKWFNLFLKSPVQLRRKIAAQTMRSLKKFSDKGEGDEDTSAGEQLFSYLQSSEFELIGVSPNVMYAKLKGSREDLRAVWVHPFGSPTLLLKHKRLPILILTNPGLRYNESMLSEMKFNQENFESVSDIVGISG